MSPVRAMPRESAHQPTIAGTVSSAVLPWPKILFSVRCSRTLTSFAVPLNTRAVSIQVLPFEVHARWHFLEKNATWRPRFCKEQNRNRCSRRNRDRVSHQEFHACAILVIAQARHV